MSPQVAAVLIDVTAPDDERYDEHSALFFPPGCLVLAGFPFLLHVIYVCDTLKREAA